MSVKKLTIEKIMLVIAIVGVLIAGAAYLNDLRSDHDRPEAQTVTQTTTGSGSPAIAGVSGSVTVRNGQ